MSPSVFNGPRIRSPESLARTFDSAALDGHFLLCRTPDDQPPGWRRLEGRGWHLGVGPRLPVVDLVLEDGAWAGWLLGHPIDPAERTIVSAPLTIPRAVASARCPEAFDAWLHRLGGRYAAVAVEPVTGVFPDAYGALPVFRAVDSEVVASNPFLVAAAAGGVADSPLVEALRIDETGYVFGLGTTPFVGVEHVLPNHFFDLAAWCSTRVWPRAPIEPASVGERAAAIGDVISATIAAAASAGPTSVGLTAGGDTRLLLACSRDVVDQVKTFTIAFPDDLGSTDVRWAPRIAERAGVHHDLLPWVEPTEEDVRLYMYRTGCMSGEQRGRLSARSFAQIGTSGPYLAGVLGELFVAFESRPSDARRSEFPPDELVRRLALPRHPELVARAERWLAEAPDVGLPQLLGIAQNELLDSAWGSAHTTGQPDGGAVQLYPFAHRAVIEAALAIPPEERRGDRLRTAIIASRWPELLEIPFNQRTLPVRLRRKRRRAWDLTKAVGRRSKLHATRLVSWKTQTFGVTALSDLSSLGLV